MKRFVSLTAIYVALLSHLSFRVAAFGVPPTPLTTTREAISHKLLPWGFGSEEGVIRLQRHGQWPVRSSRQLSASSLQAVAPSSASPSPARSTTAPSLASSIDELKRVLEREYTSFFNPMEREWYSEKVTFEDPLVGSLSGVDSYQANVDMLAARNLVGKVLFGDAGIVLHSVTGGSIRNLESGSVEIEDIVTRWTLRMTFKALPWQPTARFSGISVYRVVPGGPKGALILKQTDYWDSINLQPGGTAYQKVDRSVALTDFLGQVQPGSFAAPSAGPELPYSLLRRGDGYEVRRYPAFVAVETDYERRDEGFLTLGGITSGESPYTESNVDVLYTGASTLTRYLCSL
jgi:Uncharacterized conserved protein (DUF2358)/SOUL heme-binding protein